jgi:hypothetical protein
VLKAVSASISFDSTIRLHPLSKQYENGVVIIGRGDQFLELPPEGLDFLSWLNDGLTVTDARARFEARHQAFPDHEVLDVMQALLECEFVAEVDGRRLVPRPSSVKSSPRLVPQRWAQLLFSRPMLIAWLVFVAPSIVLWVITPALWPRRGDYFWIEYNSLVILTAMLLWLFGMLVHESAHWLACRAKGIEATITWTQRLGFFPMSQTVMHNIWAVPRAARFLPLGAGMLWDVFSIAVALYALYFEQAGLLALPWPGVDVLKFYILLTTMALASQFWLFSKMDGYFLVSALLGQRNLQSDTYAWFKAKAFRRGSFAPPAGGMRFLYIYALITLVWGGLVMGQFLLVHLPIKLQLIWESGLKIWHRADLAPVDFADGLAVFASQVLYYGLLIYAYLRDTLPRRWRS